MADQELEALVSDLVTKGESPEVIQSVIDQWDATAASPGVGMPRPNDPSKLPKAPYTSEQFTERTFGGLVNNAFAEGATLLNPTKWPGVIKGALQAKQAGDARLADEARHPQPDAFQYPGDRLIRSLQMAPGAAATEAYEHPLSTAAMVAPGVPAAVRGAKRVAQSPGVRAVASTVASHVRDHSVLEGLAGGLEGYELGGWPGAAAGAVLGSKLGRVAKRWFPKDTPTAGPRVPAPPADPMAAGMKAMGKVGSRRYEDLLAAENLGTNMAKRAPAPPPGRIVPRTPPEDFNAALAEELTLRSESVDLPLSHPAGGGFTVPSRMPPPPGRLVPGSGPSLTQELQDALVEAQTPPVTSVELPLSHPEGGGFTVPPGPGANPVSAPRAPAAAAAAGPATPMESELLRRNANPNYRTADVVPITRRPGILRPEESRIGLIEELNKLTKDPVTNAEAIDAIHKALRQRDYAGGAMPRPKK